MSQYLSILTKTGAARLAQAASGNPLALSAIAVGDGAGQPVVVADTRTQLVNEVHRGALSALYQDPQNPHWFVAEMVIPGNIGGWSIREVGLYDTAGNLVAYGNFPESYKPIISEGAAKELIVRMIVGFGTAAHIELSIDPNIISASQQWVLAQLGRFRTLSRPRRFFLSQI